MPFCFSHWPRRSHWKPSVWMGQSFLSSCVFDVFLCLFNMNIKSWCKGPVSAVCCRCACTDSPGGGVLSRQRPKLSWHNFHHWIRKEMPSLELQVPTQSWKDPGKIPKRVCLSYFFFFSDSDHCWKFCYLCTFML